MPFLPLILLYNPGDSQVYLTCPGFDHCHPPNSLWSHLPASPVFPDSGLSAVNFWSQPQIQASSKWNASTSSHADPDRTERGRNSDEKQISSIPTIFLKLCPAVLNQWHMLSERDSPNRIEMSRCYLSHNSSKLFFSTWSYTFLSKWQEGY